MRAGLHIACGAVVLGACAAPAPQPMPQGPLVVEGVTFRTEARAGGLAVLREGQPFHYSDGLLARRAGQAACAAGGRRLSHGIRDRFEAGAWVYPEGCA